MRQITIPYVKEKHFRWRDAGTTIAMYSSTTPLLKPTAPSVATVHLAPYAHLAPYVLGEKETRHVSPALPVHIVLIAVHVPTVLVDIFLYLHLGCLSTCPTHHTCPARHRFPCQTRGCRGVPGAPVFRSVVKLQVVEAGRELVPQTNNVMVMSGSKNIARMPPVLSMSRT